MAVDESRPEPKKPWRNERTKPKRDFGPIGRLSKKERKFYNTVCNNLTSLLRSNAPRLGMHMRQDGYVSANEILDHLRSDRLHGRAGFVISKGKTKESPDGRNLTLSMEYLIRVSQTAGFRRRTRRFHVIEEGGEHLIRANYGHSATCGLDPRNIRTPIDDPSKARNVIYSGKRSDLKQLFGPGGGLSPNDGNLIRCATCAATSGPRDSGHPQQSGMNAVAITEEGAEIMVWVDVPKALADKVRIYINAFNEVLVEPSRDGLLPLEYVRKVVLLREPAAGLSAEDWSWTPDEEEAPGQSLARTMAQWRTESL